MLTPLLNLRTTLDAIQPGMFNACLAALLWVVLWGVRRWKPLFFAKLPPALQAWPAMVAGAVVAALSASTGMNAGQAVVNALAQAAAGLLSGVLAVGLHRTLKESALPYGTNQIPPKASTTPLVSIVLMSVFVVACTGMPAKTIVADACTVVDSGNPAIGALCLTAEEIASLFGHVKAARAFRAAHASAAPNQSVDVCEGTP